MSEALSPGSPLSLYNGQPLISVVVPVRNEAPNILALISEIRSSVSETEKIIIDQINDADLRATVRALRKMKENLLAMLSESGDESPESDAA